MKLWYLAPSYCSCCSYILEAATSRLALIGWLDFWDWDWLLFMSCAASSYSLSFLSTCYCSSSSCCTLSSRYILYSSASTLIICCESFSCSASNWIWSYRLEVVYWLRSSYRRRTNGFGWAPVSPLFSFDDDAAFCMKCGIIRPLDGLDDFLANALASSSQASIGGVLYYSSPGWQFGICVKLLFNL